MLSYVAIFPNGRKYIGVTSRELKARILDHKMAYTRMDNKFYRALRKYGFDNVEFRIIRHHDTMECAFNTEKILIARHKTNIFGYNTTTGGEGCPGRIFTDEHRKVISKAQKQRFTDEAQRNATSEKMKEWIKNNPELHKKNMAKRINSNRTKQRRLNASLKQKAYVARTENYSELSANRLKSFYESNPSIREQISRSLGGTPIEVYKNGELVITFPTIIEAARKLSINHGNIGMVLKGKRNHAGGYTFKRKFV